MSELKLAQRDKISWQTNRRKAAKEITIRKLESYLKDFPIDILDKFKEVLNNFDKVKIPKSRLGYIIEISSCDVCGEPMIIVYNESKARPMNSQFMKKRQKNSSYEYVHKEFNDCGLWYKTKGDVKFTVNALAKSLYNVYKIDKLEHWKNQSLTNLLSFYLMNNFNMLNGYFEQDRKNIQSMNMSSILGNVTAFNRRENIDFYKHCVEECELEIKTNKLMEQIVNKYF